MDAKLNALKQQMGLLPASSSSGEEAKQLGAGKVEEAQVEEVSEAEAANIPEAQLLEEFDRLGDKAN